MTGGGPIVSTYAIDDGHSNQITTGLSEHNAGATAQRIANERRETVYLYEVGSDEAAVAVVPETSLDSEDEARGDHLRDVAKDRGL